MIYPYRRKGTSITYTVELDPIEMEICPQYGEWDT